MKIRKKDAESGSVLSGFTFNLNKGGQTIKTETTGNDGTITFSNLEYGDYKINVNQDISSMGTIKLDDYASITLSDSKITFSYKKNDNNNNVYSDYVYKTDATYVKRATEY